MSHRKCSNVQSCGNVVYIQLVQIFNFKLITFICVQLKYREGLCTGCSCVFIILTM